MEWRTRHGLADRAAGKGLRARWALRRLLRAGDRGEAPPLRARGDDIALGGSS